MAGINDSALLKSAFGMNEEVTCALDRANALVNLISAAAIEDIAAHEQDIQHAAIMAFELITKAKAATQAHLEAVRAS